MKLIAKITEDGQVVGLVHGPDEPDQSVVVNGKKWRFDFHEYCGPMWLRKNGEPRKCQNPNNAVWDAFQKWFDKSKYAKRMRRNR